MGLIKNMLQDLERRTEAVTPDHPLAVGVRAVPGDHAPGRHTVWWGVALVLGMLALAVAWTARVAPFGAIPFAVLTPPGSPIFVDTASVADTPAREFVPSAMAEMPTAQPLQSQARGELAAPPLAPTQTDGDAAPAPDKASKRFTSGQRVENIYKQALAQLQQGHANDAQQSLQQTLALDADHAKARQLLASLLVEADALDAAAALLQEGLRRSPGEPVFSMALARIQVELGSTDLAIGTMSQGVQAAAAEPDYHAFYAALLQRAKRPDEAVQQYLVALRSDPAMPNALVGIGIALQTLGKNRDAAEAFNRARDGGLLGPALLAFVDQRLRQLQ